MQCMANKQHFRHNIASNLLNLLITETYKFNSIGYSAPDSYDPDSGGCGGINEG